jgi:hypothetical protein
LPSLILWHPTSMSDQVHQYNKKFWEELIAYFPWYDTGHIENDASNNSSVVACVFVTGVMFLLSRCLATIGGYTYRHTDWWEGIFNEAVEMGSVYVPSFIKIGSGIQKFIEDTQTHTHTATWSHEPTLFFQNKENSNKINWLTLKGSDDGALHTWLLDFWTWSILLNWAAVSPHFHLSKDTHPVSETLYSFRIWHNGPSPETLQSLEGRHTLKYS